VRGSERRWRVRYCVHYRTVRTPRADCSFVNARSALFDLYGDHLLSRGGVAPVASLVQLMSALDIAPPAVRTAVSRMVSQGWLAPAKVRGASAYRLTPRAERRLREAAARIYRTDMAAWDGHWHLISIGRVPDRVSRERLRNGLTYLGYAPLRDDTWISPHASPEAEFLIDAENASARHFTARYDGVDATLTAEAWDLDALSTEYARFLDEARDVVAALPAPGSSNGAALSHDSDQDRRAFAVRSALVHEWRKFLFRDPGLPRDLLPDPWPGDEAAAYFDEQAARLMPAAGRYVEACLGTADARPSD
jgi:phenylacetic acid degradation operon negative regulatory protein